ncbi:MAG: 16S rRNA (adenine(1518)-N(6)/adenine(1519)-N(6))-dimethyltransferase RsmA [Chloroflexota bacterium]|nr:16S rRNA (adenine(1518)-N(6)/adenine(1519)-N(6))-dimethyltransferase RsmA [Chloroflexota bacterium]
MINVRPKKRFGQHFLIDKQVLTHIISAAELSPSDVVIEIGPGFGILTKELAKQAAKVIAVEIDAEIISTLRKKISSFANANVIHGDILKISPEQLLGGTDLKVCPSSASRRYKVVANLPYYITSPVLRHFLEASVKPSIMVVMVQKEVGEAVVAASGKMSLLSLRVQFYSKPTIIAYVPANSFYPSPKVNSVILRLDVYPKPLVEVADAASFFDIISCGFSSPRKQLRNSLAQAFGIPPSQVALLLEKTGVAAERRAETLDHEEWKKLWETFASLAKDRNANLLCTS